MMKTVILAANDSISTTKIDLIAAAGVMMMMTTIEAISSTRVSLKGTLVGLTIPPNILVNRATLRVCEVLRAPAGCLPRVTLLLECFLGDPRLPTDLRRV